MLHPQRGQAHAGNSARLRQEQLAGYGGYLMGKRGSPLLRRIAILGRRRVPGRTENPARRWRAVEMPEKKTLERASRAKSPSGQAGEFVREEVEHVREG